MPLLFSDETRRCEALALYMVENSSTVRSTAIKFGISKSTVHKDITQRLSQVNPSLFKECRKILDLNKSLRHIRGGEATRVKYQNKRSVIK